MRIDIYLVQNNYYQSREKASDAIKKGIVTVDGKIINKPSYDYQKGEIKITEELLPYVSWGGMKLQRAIEEFHLNFQDKVILDIGSSTGGFTDCALKHGAKLVYAVDVGKDQLALSLRCDNRVKVFEETNIIDFQKDINFDFLVMDVSFVSITKIIPYLKRYLTGNTKLICLFKPQFEVGKVKIKNGVVKDPKIHQEVISMLINYIHSLDLYVNKLTYSTQKGKMGNLEYLALVSLDSKEENYNIKEIVLKSHTL